MMFQGTYNSDFYRAVRDLLHEQIRFQNRPDAALDPAVAQLAAKSRDELERRWQRLLAREREFRSVRPAAAVQG